MDLTENAQASERNTNEMIKCFELKFIRNYNNGNNANWNICGGRNIPTLSYMLINSRTSMLLKHCDRFEH